MDQGFYQILYTLGIDAIIFSILFLLFLLSHNYRTKHTTTYKVDKAQPKNAIYSEAETPLGKLLKTVWRTGFMDIHDKCGLFAYIYISLHWQIIIFLSAVCILGIPSLVPIYFYGNGLPNESTNKEGIANILDDEHLMIAPILYFVFFSFLAYWLVYIILRTISYRTAINKKPVFEYIIEVRGFNRNSPPKEIEPKILEKFKSQFQDDIIGIYIVPDYTKSYIASKKQEQAKERLDHFRYIENSEHKREKVRINWWSKKVDAISYYTQEIEKLQKRYEDHLQDGSQKNTGFAYIFCKTPEIVEKIIDKFQIYSQNIETLTWTVTTAPAPHEIKWENMNYNQLVTRGRRIALLAIFVVVFFIFLTPTAFVRYINDALSGMAIDTYIKGIFNTFLPTLLLLIYQGVILYHSIIFIVKQEKRVNVAMEIVSRLTKYLIFMAIYVFLLQALGMQTVVQVSTGGWDGWRTLFPNKIAETGLFFTIFMIHQALIQNGLALLQPGLIIISKIKWKLAKTPLEKMKALDSPDFDFAYETAVTLNSFLILLSYSIAYPLILIIGLIYFSIRYVIQKYLLLCTFYIDKSSTGSAIPKAYIYSILTYIFIFQLLTGLIFTINKNYPIQIVGGVLIIIAFVIYLILLWKLPNIMKFARNIIKKFKKLEEHKLDDFEHGEILYIHPVEKQQKETGEADVVLLDTLESKTQNINTSNDNDT